MPEDKKKKFGSSINEVDKTISQLEKERKGLADKANAGKLSRKENKRFGQLDTELTDASNFRTTFESVPGSEAGEPEFEVDKKTIIGTAPEGGVQGVTAPVGETTSIEQPITGGATPDIVDPNAPFTSSLGGGVGAGETPVLDPTLGVGNGQVTVPQSGSEQIIQQTVAGIQGADQGQGAGIDQEISTATFGQPGGGGLIKKPGDPLIQQGSELFRGINDPILKGQVSGQIIGSQPIFTPSGDFFAFDVVNNRRKAIQDAALLREEEKKALFSQKPPLVKDKRFQKNVNDLFFGNIDNFVKRAQDEAGEDWDLLLKDQSTSLGREFVQSMANQDFVAGSIDQVTDQIAEIDADLESGDLVFSDETLQLREDYENLQGKFLNGEVGGSVDLANEFGKLRGSTVLDKILNDQSIDIEGTVTGWAEIIDNDDNFVTETTKKKEFDKQVKIIAKGLADGQLKDSVRRGFITEDEIFERINARYGPENVTTKKVTTKRTGGGVSVTVDLNSVEEGDQEQLIGNETFNSPFGFAINSKAKEFNVSGLQYFDKNGDPQQIKDINKVKLNRIQIVKFVDPETKKITYKKVALADVTTEVPILDRNNKDTGEVEEKTTSRMIDLDVPGVKSQIKTDVVKNLDELDIQLDNFINEQGTEETIGIEGKPRG